MKQNAEIKKNEKGEYYAHVERTSACAHCGACKGREQEFIVDDVSAQGPCSIEMRSGRVLLASTIAYVIPLALFVIGLMLGYPLSAALALPGAPDLWAAALGLVLLVISYAAIRLLSPWMQRKRLFAPTITMMKEEEHKE